LGADADGATCYAMRFIRGETLQHAIDAFHTAERPGRDLAERSLGLRELLHRFVSVCSTVGYAHSRGILHRDLKPRNVMLGKYDETLVVDWGLAKPFERDPSACDSGEDTLTITADQSGSDTPTVGIVGTLAYMSPEQGEARWDRVGPPSDIFSLGAILYAILTGRPPYGWHTRGDIIDKVKRCEFPKPRQLKPKTPRALEAICLKAMAKEPPDRYATALELADDVKRWLADQPVTAWREPVLLRARRWMRRHRTLVTSAAAVLVLGVLGLAGFASVVAGKNRELQEQRHRAIAREALAIDAVKKFRDAVQENRQLRDRRELGTLRAALLKEPVAFFRQLRDQLQADRDTRPEAMAKLAGADFELASTTEQIGAISDSLRSYTASSGIWEQLVREYPTVTEYQSKLAMTYNATGVILHETGQPAEALAWYQRAQTIWERLAHDQPTVTEHQRDLARSHNNIGIVLGETGHSAEALESHRHALAIREQLSSDNPMVTEYQRDRGRSHGSIGMLLHNMGRVAEDLKSLRDAIEIQDRLVRDHPGVIEYQSDLAGTCHNFGIVLTSAGHESEALESYRRAVAIRQRLAHGNPSVTRFQHDLARSYVNIGNRLNDMGHPEEALESFRSAVAIGDRIARDNPTITEFQRELAAGHNGIGTVLSNTNRAAEALESYRLALAIWERLTRDNPSLHADQSALGITLHNIAEIEMSRRQWNDARDLFDRAARCQRAALAAMPGDPAFRGALRAHLLLLAKVHQALKQPADAVRVSRELLSLSRARPRDLYAAAGSFASSVPTAAGAERQALAAEAVDALKQAIAAGWKNATKTSRDPDLAPLRDRDDFRRLLTELFDRGFPANPFAQ
jgi:serine/threonine-protein kinase